MRALALTLLVAACGTPTDELPDDTDAVPADQEIVRTTTADGVELVADLYPAPDGAPAVLLLHMTPSGPWTRADWPRALVKRLSARGAAVLVPDRRGAGESGGEAVDAYEGPGGRLDVVASVALLTARGHDRVVIVGASNGTTSMVDYAADPDGPAPLGLGFLTGGTYTENQVAMSDLPATPALFVYGDAEDDWSEAQQGLHDGAWTFEEIAGGAHGTRMFDGPERDAVIDLLDGFVGTVLGG